MHKEQIMPLQAMDSLISIMESYKKEQKIKSPWKNIGKVSLLLHIAESKTWHKDKTHQFGGGNIDVFSIPYV